MSHYFDEDRGFSKRLYFVYGVDPMDGVDKEWHDTDYYCSAEGALYDAREAGWTNLRITEERKRMQ